MEMKLKMKRIVLGGVLLVGLLFLSLSVWIYFIIASVPTERLDQVVPGPARDFAGVSTLEHGSVVRLEDLKTFVLFSASSHEGGFEQWLEAQKNEDRLESIDADKLLLKRDLKLGRPLVNDCQSVYCLQHRLTFDQIPGVFWKGLIGIEDYRFLDHFGIDPRSILRAIFVDLVEMRFVQGGSTLTQQLAKNLFYSSEKTLTRKFKEMVTAIYIDAYYPKESVLEAYFNEVYWGAFQGVQIKGLYAASLFYFNKTPATVSPYEAAILIGLLKGPNFYHPVRQIERLITRTNVVYERLIEIGLFSPELDEAWSEDEWERWHSFMRDRAHKRELLSLWHAIENIESSEQAFMDAYETWVFYKVAHEHLQKVRGRIKERNSEVSTDISAKVVMRNLRGGEDFLYYSKPERRKSFALSAEAHQIGSTFKPFIYRIFLNEGKEIDDEISLEPFTLKLKSGDWTPQELIDVKADDYVSLGEALVRSLNRPVIRVANEIGFDLLEQRLNESYEALNLLTPLREYPSQLLGALEMSPLALMEVLSKFVKEECRLKHEGGDFVGLLELLSRPHEGTIRHSVSQELSQLRFFGKTGTSNRGHDTWFIFFDGERIGTVWLGNEGARE